jgi:hypothetical protein
MSDRKSLKQIITEAVAKELPDELREERDSPVDGLLFKWWQTGRQEGLRLTDYGDLAFRMAEIEFYQYDLVTRPADTHHAWVIELNKKIKCPYYIGVNKDGKKSKPFIRLYDSKIAMMVSLYGNVNEYLDSIKVKK